jgi:hypothetical protein
MKSITHSIISLFLLTCLACNQGKVSSHHKQPKTENKSKDLFDETFIGKNTNDLKSYHNCWGTLISENPDRAVSNIAPKIEDCRNGKAKIFLEKILYRTADGKAIFEIVDELNIEANDPTVCFSTVWLKLNDDNEEKYYVIKYFDNRKETITKIFSIWKIDLEKMRFQELPIKPTMKCPNPDWYEG